MLLRGFTIQGSWNYELMIGNGMGFALEPALRELRGNKGSGEDNEQYRAALARESAYFNAHPYLTGLAIGALARVELDREPPERIDRFRKTLCGPLGSVGDRLVWTAWLPACSLMALFLFGIGAGPWVVALGFLIVYNLGHVGLRIWALDAGWKHGLRVANALGNPVLQRGANYIGRVAAVLAGLALPLAAHRAVGGGSPIAAIPAGIVIATPLLAVLLVRLHGRAEGWKLIFGLLSALVLYSVVH